MFLEIVLVLIVGVVAGVVTGLIPGLHINLVAIILLSISPILLQHLSVISVVSFIIAMSITHTFTDFIAATYLGAPNDDTAMALLPAHRLLLEGKGHEAIKLTLIGSLLCLISVIAISPLLIFIVPFIFEFFRDFIWAVLLFVLIFMIFSETSLKKRYWAFVVIGLSGVLGVIVLNMISLEDPLLPMLSGLFGVSVLIISLTQNTKIPLQKISEEVHVSKKDLSKALSAGVFSGSLVSIFPGLGPAQAAVIANQFVRKINVNGYLILVGGINTVSMILSLITLFTIDKARNGSIVVVSQMVGLVDISMLVLFFSVALIAGCIATFFTLNISKLFCKFMSKVNYSLISILIIIFICLMVFYFSGVVGLLILLVATLIGLIPNLTNVSRSTSMACLILPIVLFGVL